MRFLLRLFNFYLDASIHVALAILALVYVTILTLNIPEDKHLIWFLFFGSIACYNFVKYGVEAKKYIMVTDLHQRHIQWVSLVALVAALYHLFFLNIQVYSVIAVLVVLTGLYAIPVLPHTRNLRSLGGLKIYIVALVWAGATVILPIIGSGQDITLDAKIETVQRFLFVLILLIPFEIRDLAYDSSELNTLPQRFGIQKTKNIGGFAVLLFFLLTLLKGNASQIELVANGIIALLLGLLLWKTRKDGPTYFASFYVEAVPIVWWGLLSILQIYIIE